MTTTRRGRRGAASEHAAVVPAMRAVLILASVLVFLAGVQLFCFPAETERYFSWTIASPMTATFLGAAYWSAIALELGAAVAPTWHEARVAVPAVFTFTALTLVVTLVHLELFHLGGAHQLQTRLITVAWIAIYAGVPVAMLVAATTQLRRAAAVARGSGLPPVIRLLLGIQAVVLLVLGVALLVAPSVAETVWPWPVTPLTGRAIGAWLVGLGVASAHALVIGAARPLRPLGLAGVAFTLLQVVALARYGEALRWGSLPAYGYVVGLAVIGGTGGWLLWVGARGSR